MTIADLKELDGEDTRIFFKDGCVGPITLNYGRCGMNRFEKGDVIEIKFSDCDTLEVTVIDAIYRDDQTMELTVEPLAEGQKESKK